MKKIVTIAALFLGFTALSQDADERKIQAGLSLSEGLIFNQSGTNLISSPGVGNEFGVGVNVHYHFAEYLTFSSGVIFDLQSYRYDVNEGDDGKLFYVYRDRAIFQNQDFIDGDGSFVSNIEYDGIFNVTQRKHKPVYLTVPTMLTFNTKVYGYMRYFGRAGLRNSFAISNKSSDQGEMYELNPQNKLVPTGDGVTTMDEMEPEGEMSFYKGALGISGGFEWKFSGNVSLQTELAYYHGFTQLFRGDAVVGDDDKNKSLFNQNNDNSFDFRTFDAKQQQLNLKVSLLF